MERETGLAFKQRRIVIWFTEFSNAQPARMFLQHYHMFMFPNPTSKTVQWYNTVNRIVNRLDTQHVGEYKSTQRKGGKFYHSFDTIKELKKMFQRFHYSLARAPRAIVLFSGEHNNPSIKKKRNRWIELTRALKNTKII